MVFRYGLYLLILVPICTLLPVLAYLEPGGLVAVQALVSRSQVYEALIVFLLTRLAPIGILFGVLLAFSAATLDKARHGSQDATGLQSFKRLILNLIWCGLYVTPLLGVDIVLVQMLWGSFHKLIPLTSAPAYYLLIYGPMISLGLLNGLAVLWATFQTATTTEVLTPQRLWQLLHRTTRLGGA